MRLELVALLLCGADRQWILPHSLHWCPLNNDNISGNEGEMFFFSLMSQLKYSKFNDDFLEYFISKRM